MTSENGAIDTNVSGGTKQIPGTGGSVYEKYIVRLFNANYTYVSAPYAYDDLVASVWATDILGRQTY